MHQRFPYRCSLHLDARVNSMKINSLESLQNIIRKVAKQADMAILNLSLSDVGVDAKCLGREPRPEESGYSAVALITTSHITLHTWPEYSYIMFDLVSCKRFREDLIKQLLQKELEIKETIYYNYQDIENQQPKNSPVSKTDWFIQTIGI